MSVTFNPYPTPPSAWRLGCWAPDDENALGAPTWEEAQTLVEEHVGTCEECAANGGPTFEPVESWPSSDIGQARADMVLRALGLVEDATPQRLATYQAVTDLCVYTPAEPELTTVPRWEGVEDAKAFLGRVLTAIALAPYDHGVPAMNMHPAGPLGGTHTGGRRAGYLQEQLERLREIAEYADRHGQQVAWH